jgi:hypothetical protein
MAKNKSALLRPAQDQDMRTFDASIEAPSLQLVAHKNTPEGALAANPQGIAMLGTVQRPESGLLLRLIDRIKTL